MSNTPFRSTKLTAYEGGIRTPLVVQWPAVIRQGGQVTRHVGHVIDILPTCLEVAGAKYPASFNGRALAAFGRQEPRPALLRESCGRA